MIKLVNVSKYYSSNNVIALGLRKVNLELHRNEFVAIVGESGSGKTTLLNVISGIDSYEDGEMYVNGEETSYFSITDMENYRKKYVAFVFQNYNLIDSYTVLQNVEAPLILSGYPKDKIRSRATEIIRKVGLEDHMNHKATKLSGGQKQRVVIARALAKDCPIIAADEPTGNLDSKSAKQIIELLHEISKEKLVIMVTHDFSQVEAYATRRIRIYDGEVVEDLSLAKVEKMDMPTIPDEDHQIRFMDYLKISLRNLLAVPKKSLLMLLVFTFFSFFIAIAYGAYQLSMDEVSYNYNYQFANTNPNRIILRKTDNSVFTQTELSDLKDLNLVQEIVYFDYVMDQEITMISTENTQMGLDGLALPVGLVIEDDLVAGRLPENENEMVLAMNAQIISTHEADLLDVLYEIDDYSRYISQAYGLTVVGLVDLNSLVLSPNVFYDNYFLVNEDAWQNLQVRFYGSYANNLLFVGDDEDKQLYLNTALDITIDNSLADDLVQVPSSYYGSCSDVCTVSGTLFASDYYVDNEFTDFTVEYHQDMSDSDGYIMNQATYDKIFYSDVYQVSLLTSTDVGVGNLIRNLQREPGDTIGYKYKVLYPYDSETSNDFEGLVLLMMNIGFIVLIMVTLVGSTLITYVIFRAIINTKLHDYAIFRTIGANKKVIRSFIYLENLFIVVVSFVLLTVVTIAIPSSLAQNTVLSALKVYTVVDYLVFFLLLVLMSLFISRKYNNRIFRESVQTTLKTDMG
ncbi:MAG: ABC transporter ATP-binding protein [Bacilli bacterium]|nr:ABC transporter ATP-binding protein [Bacilli bacterium]MBN2877006.1 ABC transporter ATP-binding protein [Bacilli bacterium]